MMGFLFFSIVGNGQSAQGKCLNPEFDKKVDSYLSYSVPVITVPEAAADKARYFFLDAREKNEFDISHIKNAVHVGYNDFELLNMHGIPKDAPIVIYCSIGYRSEKIGEKLIAAGYTDVHNLYGSLFEWVNQDHSICSKEGNYTKTVHAYNKKWSRWLTSDQIKKIW